MDGNDLASSGFATWRPFALNLKSNLLPAMPLTFGVYVIRSKKLLKGLRGDSDIVYIGSATNQRGLRGRIGQFFSPGPTQPTNKRIQARIGGQDHYDIAWVENETIGQARSLESDLLDKYLSEHDELPPENRKR